LRSGREPAALIGGFALNRSVGVSVSLVRSHLQQKGEDVSISLRSVGRRTGATLAATGAVVSVLGVASAPASSSGMLFDGGSSGPTAEVAIQGAIDDAVVSASAYGLFNCTQVGEAQVFPRPNDPFGRFFSAQVQVFCR
jgi:hypothetical protein